MTPRRTPLPSTALRQSDLPSVVALGGGHGLAASLSAIRRITPDISAVVTVADNGGSSGRLRTELGVLPPGDLRMALAALCGDDDWGRTWADVLQHRFASGGELHNHAVGNLLIVALWELLGDHVNGLDLVAELLGAHGRVLPMSSVPLDIEALVRREVEGERRVERVRGQVEVASTDAEVIAVQLDPPNPLACPEAVQAVRSADWVIVGPGSWFTSVIPNLLVPDLFDALHDTDAKRIVILNLTAQPGETDGFSPENHLEVLTGHAPDLRIDAVVADENTVEDERALRRTAGALGAEVVMADVAMQDGTPYHDPLRLAAVLEDVMG